MKEFALDHHVDPSIIYAIYAYEYSNKEDNLWAQFDKFIRPSMDNLIQKLNGGLSHSSTSKQFANYYLTNIFKTSDDE